MVNKTGRCEDIRRLDLNHENLVAGNRKDFATWNARNDALPLMIFMPMIDMMEVHAGNRDGQPEGVMADPKGFVLTFPGMCLCATLRND